jgi:hypothetical protein
MIGIPRPIINDNKYGNLLLDTINPNKTQRGVKKESVKDKPARVARSKPIEKPKKTINAIKNKIG